MSKWDSVTAFFLLFFFSSSLLLTTTHSYYLTLNCHFQLQYGKEIFMARSCWIFSFYRGEMEKYIFDIIFLKNTCPICIYSLSFRLSLNLAF